MRYIMLKNGIIVDLMGKEVSSYEVIDTKTAIEKYGEEKAFIFVFYYDQYKGHYLEWDDHGGRSMDNWYLDDIEKQAQTLEELCDCFCCDNKVFNTLNELRAYRCNSSVPAYGAIWTKWGLKYAGKINKEGVLEFYETNEIQ